MHFHGGMSIKLIFQELRRSPEKCYALVQLLQLLKEFFQIAGWFVTAIRTRLSGFALRDRVLVGRNLRYMECNEDEIIKVLKD